MSAVSKPTPWRSLGDAIREAERAAIRMAKRAGRYEPTRPKPEVPLPGEKWRAVVSFGGNYIGLLEVTEAGDVRSVPSPPGTPRRAGRLRGNMLKCFRRKRGGYLTLKSRGWDGVEHTLSVHRLVLEAFVGPCPEGMEACHRDRDVTNNHISNLRWDTPKANAADRRRHKTQPTRLVESDVQEIRALFGIVSQRKIGLYYGVSAGAISGVVYHTNWAWLAPETGPKLESRRAAALAHLASWGCVSGAPQLPSLHVAQADPLVVPRSTS
jgi:hypothetical protein